MKFGDTDTWPKGLAQLVVVNIVLLVVFVGWIVNINFVDIRMSGQLNTAYAAVWLLIDVVGWRVIRGRNRKVK